MHRSVCPACVRSGRRRLLACHDLAGNQALRLRLRAFLAPAAALPHPLSTPHRGSRESKAGSSASDSPWARSRQGPWSFGEPVSRATLPNGRTHRGHDPHPHPLSCVAHGPQKHAQGPGTLAGAMGGDSVALMPPTWRLHSGGCGHPFSPCFAHQDTHESSPLLSSLPT